MVVAHRSMIEICTLYSLDCQFRLPKLTLFGYDFSSLGITPLEEKLTAILNACPPQDASQVRYFIKLLQYLIEFLPDFTQEVDRLRRPLRKNELFVRGKPQE